MHNDFLFNLAGKILSSESSNVELHESKQFIKNEQFLAELAKQLKKIGESKDLNAILAAEKMMLGIEEKNIMSKEHAASLRRALIQFDNSKNSLELIDDKLAYYKASAIYADTRNDRKNGLPRDSFRKFIDSQEARIKNNLIHPFSDMDKLVLETRLNNLKIAEKIYIEKQKYVLSLDVAVLEKSADIRNLPVEDLAKKYPD
ncbi:MAG: hypothetical protein FWF99_00725 [Desulfovibrionaceae bacterium]|nr:hypothetical protein [Desulfovibrionaceae bacterium]